MSNPRSIPTDLRNSHSVSVIIPTFRFVEGTLEAVESVLSQTHRSWELFVIDDGSKPDIQQQLSQRIEALNDPRIEFLPLPENSGVAHARNTGIEAATGRFIAFLDADDLWHPEKLERQLAFMTSKNAAFSFTTYTNLYPDNGTSYTRIPPQIVSYDDLLFWNVIGNSTVILDRSNLDVPKIPNLRRRQDFAFWLKILRSGTRGFGLQDPLTIRRMTSGSLSSNKFIAARDTWKMYRVSEAKSIPATAWIFSRYLFNSLLNHIQEVKARKTS